MIVFKKIQTTIFTNIVFSNKCYQYTIRLKIGQCLRSWGLRFSMFVLEPLAIDPSKWLLPKLDVGMFCDC